MKVTDIDEKAQVDGAAYFALAGEAAGRECR
jgi:hypothetical protein